MGNPQPTTRGANTPGPDLFNLSDRHKSPRKLLNSIRAFSGFGRASRVMRTDVAMDGGNTVSMETLVNEFWTSKQRAAHSIHEVSYRACFKPQLPHFFIQRLTQAGQRVYDPFMGRGTTPVEAALCGRIPCGSDANPISVMLTKPRIQPPDMDAIRCRLDSLSLEPTSPLREDLLVFYHPDTLREVTGLRDYFIRRAAAGEMDSLDEWLRMVALNRLTGHSPGFFSVYTLPPNQAVSLVSQEKINRKRNQTPPPRDVRSIILKKSKSLLSDCTTAFRNRLAKVKDQAAFSVCDAGHPDFLEDDSVHLVVTSPPFLDTVDYVTDHWLRGWFAGVDPETVQLTIESKVEVWTQEMTGVFKAMRRILAPGAYVAFEVGEVNKGSIKLEDYVIPAGMKAGLKPVLVMINNQEFTKTSNCWGVDNAVKGTNTNRIVLLRKP